MKSLTVCLYFHIIQINDLQDMILLEFMSVQNPNIFNFFSFE